MGNVTRSNMNSVQRIKVVRLKSYKEWEGVSLKAYILRPNCNYFFKGNSTTVQSFVSFFVISLPSRLNFFPQYCKNKTTIRICVVK